ncbi:putative transposase [Burkholderia lata]|uniref:Putative transposase n=1 Tax=Burkholderia lata (strain ATCC 17760 / DSM 23089 / LMG 22485 / NCIMB 9086 / R18194 / 383) TaxID=482957 RepID=A0A6P2YA72_BURL3|nr:putative transposase [Burkholderia lata]
MAQGFVTTMKRDYAAFMPKPDMAMAIHNLVITFGHDNEQPLHSVLKQRSPREFG